MENNEVEAAVSRWLNDIPVSELCEIKYLIFGMYWAKKDINGTNVTMDVGDNCSNSGESNLDSSDDPTPDVDTEPIPNCSLHMGLDPVGLH